MRPADCTPAPSSVKRRTPRAASSAIGAKRSPAPPDGDRPGDGDLGGRPRREIEHVAHRLGRVERRVGVGHGHHRGEAAERGGPGAGLDRLGLLVARARAGGCGGRPDRGPTRQPAGVEDPGAAGNFEVVADRGDPLALDQPRRPRRCPSRRPPCRLGSRPSSQQPRSATRCSLEGSPGRAGGRGRPCAPRPRCAPGR